MGVMEMLNSVNVTCRLPDILWADVAQSRGLTVNQLVSLHEDDAITHAMRRACPFGSTPCEQLAILQGIDKSLNDAESYPLYGCHRTIRCRTAQKKEGLSIGQVSVIRY